MREGEREGEREYCQRPRPCINLSKDFGFLLLRVPGNKTRHKSISSFFFHFYIVSSLDCIKLNKLPALFLMKFPPLRFYKVTLKVQHLYCYILPLSICKNIKDIKGSIRLGMRLSYEIYFDRSWLISDW